MRSILVCLAFLTAFVGFSQIPPTTSDGTTLTPGGKFEKFYDYYGNEYNLRDLMIDTVTPSQKSVTYPNECTNSGYFKLYFEDGSGFELPNSLHQERRAVLCQLFKELSNFIVPLNPTTSVNIWVRKFEFYIPSASSSNISALSSGLYSMPMNASTIGGIVDNEIWKTINSGINSYTNVALPIYSNSTNNTVEPPFYHGIIAFNFSNPAINWHTNLSQTPPSNLYDMYTIGLHEITHSLGFNSLISASGISLFSASGYNYYTRYDSFLKTSNNGLNLISNAGNCSSMYGYTFNPNVPVSILTQTNCSIAPVFTGTVNQTIHTDNSFLQGTSLSHFRDVCHTVNGVIDNQVANMYYVMSGATGTGVMKRFLKPEERSVLCDLGYKVQGVYGSNLNLSYKNYAQSMCSGNGIVGVNDGISNGNYIYVVNQGASLTFNTTTGSPYNIIANDPGAVSFECPELVYSTGGYSIGNNIPNTSFSFDATGSATPGITLIRYVPISASGKRGNITYIYVIVNDNTNCSFSACNMVSNGGFENGNGGCGEMNVSSGNIAFCWAGQSGSPDLYRRNCTNTAFNVPYVNAVSNFDTWNNGISGAPANNAFAALLKTTLPNNGSVYEESFQVKLSSPLQQGVSYKLRFFARLKSTFLNPTPAPVGLVISSSLNSLSNAGNLYMTNNPVNYDQEGTTFISIGNSQNWQFYEYVFTHDGPSGFYNLMLGLDNEAILDINQKYVFIDDIQLFPSITAPDLTMPSIFCINQSPYNLLLATNYGTGTFSGNGVSNVGTDFFFNPAIAGVGTHTITYNYTNNLGCVMQDFQTVTVVNSTINVSALASPQTICSGGSTTLTATGGVSYNWNPGNSSTNPFVVSNITTNTNYTLIATNSDGCQTTIQVPVYVSPSSSCCSSPNISIPNNSISTSYASSITNLTIEVQGQFTVNSNLTLTGCTLRMAPNAKIIVNAGFALELTNCTLFSCSDMWQGINVLASGTLKMTGTRIEDALEAVSSLGSGGLTVNLNINSCTFNKNKTGIYLQGYSNLPAILNNTNSTFDCTASGSPTSPNGNLKAPYAGQKSHYGIHLFKINGLTFGGATLPNIFQNLEVGIYVQQGDNISIVKNSFSNINSLCPVSNACNSTSFKGWGIYAEDVGNITIGNSTNNALGNSFSNSYNGISLINTPKFAIYRNTFNNIKNLPVWNGTTFVDLSETYCVSIKNYNGTSPNINYIRNNTFANIEYGIYYNAFKSSTLNINQNQFSNFNSNNAVAIYLLENPIQSIIVNGNVFNQLATESGIYAIRIQNAMSQLGSGASVSANRINNVQTGIWLTNYSNSSILNHNTTTMSFGSIPSGIFYPTGLPNVASYGIYLQNCQNTTVRNNFIQKAAPDPSNTYTTRLYGIFADMGCINSIFQDNNLQRLGTGIQIQGLTNNPLQLKCNYMSSNMSGLSLNNTSIGNQGTSSNPQDNQWATLPSTMYNDGARYVRQPSNWTQTFFFSRSNSLPMFPPVLGMTPGNSITFSNGSSPSYNCAISCTGSGCPQAAMGMVANKQGEYSTLSEEDAKVLDVEVYKILMKNADYYDPTSISGLEISAYLDSLETTNAGNIYRFEEKIVERDTLGSIAEVQSILPSSDIEINFKIVNDIYWRTWFVGIHNFSPEDSAALYDIAYQDPSYGGTAVFTARVMLGIDVENGSTRRSSNSISTSDFVEAKFVRFFPNPATDFVNYEIIIEVNEIAQLEIFDLFGRVIFSKKIDYDSKTGFIDFRTKSFGFYTFNVKMKNKNATGKLVIE